MSLLQRGVEATPQLTHCLFVVIEAKEESEEHEEVDEEAELGRGETKVSEEKLGKK